MNLTRRNALKSSACVLALGGLAGCLDDVDASDGEFDAAYASFFALADWSQAVAGDRAEIENPVDYGQLGHGWEPDGDLPREVASTNAFVYLDSPEFGWAQDLVDTLESDYDSVASIDALDGLEDEMLESGHDHEDEEHSDEDDHEDDEEEHHDDEDGHENETVDEHDEEEHHDEEDNHENETEDEHHDEEEDDHGHDEEEGGHLDPHIWVDPVYAQAMVDTIAAGFAEIDPDNADTYESNAGDYNDRLAELDAAYEAMVEEAERSTAVLAGHSSFQYLEARYGFEIHTASGISPDASPSQSEISETLAVIDDNDIDVILYDRFESDRLAETLVENSNATETMALTAGAGTTEEWADEGLDFVDQMEEVTLPALREALGAA